MKKIVFTFFILALSFSFAAAQEKKAKFNYAAQKKFIPAELGKIYLGMPFDEFARQANLKKAEAGDMRFDWLALEFPYEKGNVAVWSVRIHGLTQEDKKEILFEETVKQKNYDGEEYDVRVERVKTNKIAC